MSSPVSVVTTVYNEIASIGALLDSLANQTRPADEIVVCDAGSTDGTLEFLHERIPTMAHLTVLREPGNRSHGRNTAIAAARYDLIACIDGGCTADPDWLEHLTAPFTKGAGFVGGFYRPGGRTALSTAIGLVMVYVREEAEQSDFLPSARSVAFTREAWKQSGGFPEDVEFAEDTLFDERVIAAGFDLVPALDAVVRWKPPDRLGELARTAYRWGHGDGLAGLRGFVYKRIAQVMAGSLLAAGVAGVVYPPAVAVPIAGLAVDVVRRTRFKYRWMEGASKYLLIPVAHLTATVAGLTGFVRGRSERGR